MFVPPENKAKNNKQHKNQVPKEILDKEISEIKQLKTAAHVDTKDRDKRK